MDKRAAAPTKRCGRSLRGPERIAAFYDAHADHTALCFTPPTFPVSMQQQREYHYVPQATAQAYNDETRAQYQGYVAAGLATALQAHYSTPGGLWTRPTSTTVITWKPTAKFNALPFESRTETNVFGGNFSERRLCYARIGFGEVTNWTEPGDMGGQHVTTVDYRQRVVSTTPWFDGYL